MVITKALRQMISDEGYSINSLAAAAGVPQPVLSRFVRSESSMNGESLDKLAQYLGVELKQVIYWDEYVAELEESGAMDDAWNEHSADAWSEYESDAWSEYEQDAWAEAVSGGDYSADDYDEWRESEYAEWYVSEYQEWRDSEYAEWRESYLADAKEELQSRPYVVLFETRE